MVTHTRFAEGDCLQTLHLGPYADEAPVLAGLHDRVMPGQGSRSPGRTRDLPVRPAPGCAGKLNTIRANRCAPSFAA